MRPRLAACILITLANTRRWLGRETNCIPRWGRSECNYMTSHNSFSSSWPVAPLCTPFLHDRHRQSCLPWTISLVRTQRAREEHNRANLVYSCKRSMRLRRTRGDPFPRTFSYVCAHVRAMTCGRRAHILQCSLRRFPELSNVLLGALQLALRQQIVEILTEVSVVLSAPRAPSYLLLQHFCVPYLIFKRVLHTK